MSKICLCIYIYTYMHIIWCWIREHKSNRFVKNVNVLEYELVKYYRYYYTTAYYSNLLCLYNQRYVWLKTTRLGHVAPGVFFLPLPTPVWTFREWFAQSLRELGKVKMWKRKLVNISLHCFSVTEKGITVEVWCDITYYVKKLKDKLKQQRNWWVEIKISKIRNFLKQSIKVASSLNCW